MKKRAQIWVETVIYTLIGLALIGIVLAIATPKINQSRDKIIIEQSINSLNSFDDKMREVRDNGPGNRRIIREFSLKRGEFSIDGERDSLTLILEDLSKPYSEPGITIDVGSVLVRSEIVNKKSKVILTLDYNETINLTFDDTDSFKKYDPANIPYSFTLDNVGIDESDRFVINIIETSNR